MLKMIDCIFGGKERNTFVRTYTDQDCIHQISDDNVSIDSLRHCNATLLLNSGVDLKVVSDHLGHCDIGVTANIYADVLKSTKAKVADHVSLKLW